MSFPTVLIGTQCWMAKNLNIGTKINVIDYQTNNVIIEKYCYGNLESGCDVYGGLYQWDEAMNYSASSNSNPSQRQGICSFGWHLPSNQEWDQLTTFLGEEPVAGGPLKETGFSHWISPNAGATNSTGFTGLPGGNSQPGGALFYHSTEYEYFWSTTESTASYAWRPSLCFDMAEYSKYPDLKIYSFSVRCVKD